jgi:hypothetical protein
MLWGMTGNEIPRFPNALNLITIFISVCFTIKKVKENSAQNNILQLADARQRLK